MGFLSYIMKFLDGLGTSGWINHQKTHSLFFFQHTQPIKEKGLSQIPVLGNTVGFFSVSPSRINDNEAIRKSISPFQFQWLHRHMLSECSLYFTTVYNIKTYLNPSKLHLFRFWTTPRIVCCCKSLVKTIKSSKNIFFLISGKLSILNLKSNTPHANSYPIFMSIQETNRCSSHEILFVSFTGSYCVFLLSRHANTGKSSSVLKLKAILHLLTWNLLLCLFKRQTGKAHTKLCACPQVDMRVGFKWAGEVFLKMLRTEIISTTRDVVTCVAAIFATNYHFLIPI